MAKSASAGADVAGAFAAGRVVVLVQHDPAHPERAQPGGQVIGSNARRRRVGGGDEPQSPQRVGVFFAFGDLHFDVGVGGERSLQFAELVWNFAFGIGAFDAGVPAAIVPVILEEIALAGGVEPLFDQQIMMRRRQVGVLVNVSCERVAAWRAGAAVRTAAGGAVTPLLIVGAVTARRRARFASVSVPARWRRRWRAGLGRGRVVSHLRRWPRAVLSDSVVRIEFSDTGASAPVARPAVAVADSAGFGFLLRGLPRLPRPADNGAPACRPVSRAAFPLVEFAQAILQVLRVQRRQASAASNGPWSRPAAPAARGTTPSATSSCRRPAAHAVEAAFAAGAGPRERPPVCCVFERRDVFQIGDDLAGEERADPVAGFEAGAVGVERITGPRPQVLALAPHRHQHVVDQKYRRAHALLRWRRRLVSVGAENFVAARLARLQDGEALPGIERQQSGQQFGQRIGLVDAARYRDREPTDQDRHGSARRYWR